MALSESDILRTLMASRERISAAAWVVVRDAHAAEDIFQNVSVKALTKEVEFAAEGAVLSWAFITARREAIDWLRKHKRESVGVDSRILDLLEGDWLAESAGHSSARMDALRECVESLPKNTRRLLRLRYFEGHSCDEVAKQVQAGLDAVYQRLSRAHRALKNCVEERMAKV